jgi:hypothetical protein
MARATLTPVAVAVCGYPTLQPAANAADYVYVDAGAAFAAGHQFVHTGRELILVHNANGAAQTITISSVIDDEKRTGDITTYSVGIGEYAVFGPFPVDGWRQTDGNLYLAASATDVGIAVLRLPSIS